MRLPPPSGSTWTPIGDGLADLGYRDGNNGNRLRYLLHAGPAAPADLATTFVDGFGVRQSPVYVSIARSNHTRLNDAAFPAADFQGPLYVVSEFSATDGTGGTYRNRLHYSGAQLNLQGRGFQGFATQRIEDTRTGLVTLDSVSRVFPYTGMHVQRRRVPGQRHHARAPVASGPRPAGDGHGWQRAACVPVRRVHQHRQFEHGGVLNGTLVTEASTTFTYGDGYGNPTQVQTTTWDRDPYSPHLNSAWRSTLSLGYTNDASGNWCLGVPLNRTTTSTAPDQPAVTRTTTYVTDPVRCRITQQVVEPDIPALKIVTVVRLRRLRQPELGAHRGFQPGRHGDAGQDGELQLWQPLPAARVRHQHRAETTTYEWHYDFGVPRASPIRTDCRRPGRTTRSGAESARPRATARAGRGPSSRAARRMLGHRANFASSCTTGTTRPTAR